MISAKFMSEKKGKFDLASANFDGFLKIRSLTPQ